MDTTQALKQILKPRKRTNANIVTAQRGNPVKGKQGEGTWSSGVDGQSSSGGLSEPFTFVSAATRTETISTTCGEVDIEIITAITLTDANGTEFEIPTEAP